MTKKVWLFGIIFVLLLFLTSFVSAATYDKEVTIAPKDYESELMLIMSEDYDIEVKVESNIPVNVYIMESSDWSYGNPDFTKAVYSKKGVTSADFVYTTKVDESHYLAIENPSTTQNATVSYEYTSNFEESIEEAVWWLGTICILIAVVIIVVIILIIYFAIRHKRRSPPPPPMPMHPGQGYQQTPPPPGYQQPPQYGYQQPPPPPPPPPQYGYPPQY